MPQSVATDICAVGAHLLGSAGTRLVYADGYETLKENSLLVQTVTDPSTLKALDQASTLTKDPKQFDEFELRELQAQELIPRSLAATQPVKGNQIRTLDLHSGPLRGTRKATESMEMPVRLGIRRRLG